MFLWALSSKIVGKNNIFISKGLLLMNVKGKKTATIVVKLFVKIT